MDQNLLIVVILFGVGFRTVIAFTEKELREKVKDEKDLTFAANFITTAIFAAIGTLGFISKFVLTIEPALPDAVILLGAGATAWITNHIVNKMIGH